MEKIKTDEDCLQDFLLDIECLDELSQWTYKFNIFDVLKISRTEIRHSNMLAWLLDPNENHGFGELFLKDLIQRIVEYDSEGRYDVFQLLLLDLHNFVVYREWKNIDVLLVSEKEQVLISIENKVGSKEHSNQLNRYRSILEKEYPTFKKIYVFLTPDGEEPSDVVNWCVITYLDVVEILERINNKIELLPDVELMIKNYIEVIRRDIVEDEKLIQICNKIYEKHKRALDLIYENRIDIRGQLAALIKNILKEFSTEKDIILYAGSMNSYVKFNTNFMNQKLGVLSESNSSWNTKDVYYYWFFVDQDRFRLVFELGGDGISDEQKRKFDQIIRWKKPSEKLNLKFKYKRIWGTKWYKISEDDNTEEIRDKILSALKELQKFENEFKAEVLI